MFGAKELKIIFDIIVKNGFAGERVFFSNLFYIDKNEEKQEILWVKVPSQYATYSETIACINDVEVKLFLGNIQAITLIYLQIQKSDKDFNNENQPF